MPMDIIGIFYMMFKYKNNAYIHFNLNYRKLLGFPDILVIIS